MPNAAETFAAHVADVRRADIPSHAIERAKVFILDTLGVGIAGSSAFGADELLRASRLWGDGEGAAVWGAAGPDAGAIGGVPERVPGALPGIRLRQRGGGAAPDGDAAAGGPGLRGTSWGRQWE